MPAEVRDNGAAAVADYMENAEQQGVVYTQRETRLIILGSAGAGKTTFVRRLNGDMSYPDLQESTHCVDTSIELDCNGIKSHVWNFGGQVIYHVSHRCFMTANCVYILIVNARIEDNRDCSRINYWLDTIRVYSENMAKVFIILNESDNRKQNIEDYDAFKDGEYAALIQEIYSFNIGKDMNSLNIFKNDLISHVESTGHQSFGKNDNNAMRRLKSLFEQHEKIIGVDELETILWHSGIKTKKDRLRAQELFNTLGVALSYDFIDGHVLDPYWISHGVYKVIDYLQRNKSMFVNYNELDTVFIDERGDYPPEKRDYILKLMEYYKIGLRNKNGLRGLVVPCAASQFKPKNIIVDIGSNNLVTQVEREDLQEFPADFFYRYTCANESDIKKYGEKWAIWQEGMVLAGEHATALVELIRNTRIELTVWGETKQEYIKKLESLINDLLNEYRFISYEGERKKGNRLVKFISLVVSPVVESVFKGISKGVTEGIFNAA